MLFPLILFALAHTPFSERRIGSNSCKQASLVSQIDSKAQDRCMPATRVPMARAWQGAELYPDGQQKSLQVKGTTEAHQNSL